jgi:hypothetical protein
MIFYSTAIFPISANSASVAKYAGEFMSTGVGARALGMGGAYVAGSGDATYGYWNPAGLARLTYPDLAAMHSERFAGVVNYDYASLAVPFRKTEGLAFSVIRLGVDDIPFSAIPRPDLREDTTFTDESGNLHVNRPYIDHYVSDAEYAFYLSYGKQHNRKMAFGANAKFVHKGVGDNSAWGIGFDIGALWNPWHQLKVGANIQDVTTTLLAWDTGTTELISPTFKAGVSYPFMLPFIKSRLLVAGDVDTRFEGREFASQLHVGLVSMDFRLGAELNFRNIIALRLGRDDLGYFTAGAGLILPRLNIDYAFMNHTDLKETHRVSLRIRIEEERFKRK